MSDEAALKVGEYLPARSVPRPFLLAEGTLEALKWLGIILMTFDHFNKFFYRESLPGIFAVGRVVMPLFGFILAYNLTRPLAFERRVHERMLKRLGIFGVLAMPPMVALNHSMNAQSSWWPLNVLFTLWAAVAICYLLEFGGLRRHVLAGVFFILAGTLVEYFWFGLWACLGAWAFCRKPSPLHLAGWVLGVLSLGLMNQNAWSLAVIPLIILATRIALNLPRSKWFFYAYYPAHLMALCAAKALLAPAS